MQNKNLFYSTIDHFRGQVVKVANLQDTIISNWSWVIGVSLANNRDINSRDWPVSTVDDRAMFKSFIGTVEGYTNSLHDLSTDKVRKTEQNVETSIDLLGAFSMNGVHLKHRSEIIIIIIIIIIKFFLFLFIDAPDGV